MEETEHISKPETPEEKSQTPESAEQGPKANAQQQQRRSSGRPRSQRGSHNPNRTQPQGGQQQRNNQPRNQSSRGRSASQLNQPQNPQNQSNGQRNSQNQPYQPRQGNGQNQQSRNNNQNGQNEKRLPQENYATRNGENTENSPWGMNPRHTDSGVQTRSQRGEFAKNWWARHWLESLEHLMQGVRLTRGQHYARIGQIVSMEEIKGGVLARVQGSRMKPYRVTIQLAPFNTKQWEKVFDLLADKALYVARLLAGEMPPDIEDVFSAAGVSLFPTRTIDLQNKCTCPDKVSPCKHIAATYYILGDRFDEDPFLLFRMRGRSQDQIMEALRQRRGAEVVMASIPSENGTRQSLPEPLRFPETLEGFWSAGAELNDVNVRVRMPHIPQPLLKRLGEPEVASQLTLQGQLEEAYNSISQFAILIAYADSTSTTPTNADEE
jgi:uncharacterized Zn finger protein